MFPFFSCLTLIFSHRNNFNSEGSARRWTSQIFSFSIRLHVSSRMHSSSAPYPLSGHRYGNSCFRWTERRPRPGLNPGNTAAWITSAPWPWAFESLASRDKAVGRFTCCCADGEIKRAGDVRQNGAWHTSEPLLSLINPELLVARQVCLLPDLITTFLPFSFK